MAGVNVLNVVERTQLPDWAIICILLCARLHQCLKELVDVGTQYLAFSQPIAGSDGSRATQFREVIETGRKEINE